MTNQEKKATALTRAQMKAITGGKAAFYYTYWKCSMPGSSIIQVCHYTDPSENFCAGDSTQCVYTNRACMYAECY
jgi:hypothetical protein